MAQQMIEQLSDANFDTEVLQAAGPAVVQFFAPWSSASARTLPGFEALAAEYADNVRAARINVDDNPQTASNYAVTNLPTFVLFKDGHSVARISGAASIKTLRSLFDQTAD